LSRLRGRSNGFGGAEVACWPLIPKFAGSNPDETFLRRGSKIIGPMSQFCGIPGIIWPLFPPIVPPVAARGATANCGRERHLAARVGTIRNKGMIQ
jgi:hypothetical protein